MMKDVFKCYSDLKSNRPRSFTIDYNMRNNMFLIFTPHGGGIEPGTTEICKWFNRKGLSFYSFTGIGRNCKELHITSTHFDEPILLHHLAKHNIAISFHGMTDNMKNMFNADIFLGGLNTILCDNIKNTLQTNKYSVVSSKEFPESILVAKDKNNVTNKCISGKGLQIELSETIRKSFFEGDYKYKIGRMYTTTKLDNFCTIIKDTLDNISQ